MKMVLMLDRTEMKTETMAAVAEAVLETAHLPVRDKGTDPGLVLDQGLAENVTQDQGSVHYSSSHIQF